MDLNSRELALLIWIGVFVIWVLTYPNTRNTLPALLKAAFQPKLSIIYGLMAAYSALIVYLLARIELWDQSQLKNTILWFLTVGLVSLGDITKHGQTNYFKKTVFDILGLTAILQFITGVYTFSLVVELVIVPVAALIGGMIAIAGKKPEYIQVKKLLEYILILAGLYTIGFTIYKISTDFQTFASRGTLNDFLIPGALSLLFLPLVYILSLYATREEIFIGLKNQLNPALLRFARWYTLRHFAFNRSDLRRWRNYIALRNIETNEDLRRTIQFIKQLKRIERNPPVTPAELGWSPYKAKEVLVNEGLITTYYQPYSEGEWSCSSNSFNIDDDLISNNISYYIEGDMHAAKILKLNLNVSDPAKAVSAHTKMVSCAKVLHRFAMNQEMPPTVIEALVIGKAKELQKENKYVSIYKNSWPGDRNDGYNLKLTIGVRDDMG